MLVDSRTVELTRAFYEWELRGRGWARYPYPVGLEPPFRPFPGHGGVDVARRVDDGRKQTFLSSLAERLLGSAQEDPPTAEVLSEAAEPKPLEARPTRFREYRLLFPREVRVTRSALLGWLRSLATSRGPLAIELVGEGGLVTLRMAAPDDGSALPLRQLQAALPDLVVLAEPQTLRAHWIGTAEDHFAALECGLAAEFMIPLEELRLDEPLLPVVAALAGAGAGELGLLQVLFQETRARWEESVLRSVVTAGGQPFFADAPEITKLAREKVASPLFAVCLRVAAVAASRGRAEDLVRQVAGGLAHFGSPLTNELMPLPTDAPELLEDDILDRTSHRPGMLLSADELASLIQLPGAGVQVPGLVRADERSKRAPTEVLADGTYLGRNDHLGESAPVRLPVRARTSHVHVVGASGTGKSTLLVRMILEDIAAGHGVGVLDPHGDLIDEVAGRLPDARANDVVYFDPADDETVIGWNILGAASEVEKDILASDLVGVFRRLSTSWGDQMTAVLANAILVFLESSRGGTLLDLRRFLVEPRFRDEILATVADPYVRSFWETEFPLLVGKRPQAPILTRLDMFLRSRLVRRVVTVQEPRLDFREVTDRGRIFLGKLAQGAIGEENAALLGSLLVSKFHQVTIARAGQRQEDRRPFFLYIDEFHHVATPSMASLFSGARKFGLGLTVAHQDLYQLHRSVPEVERSLLANAYTRIMFRVGEEDARGLAKGLASFEAEDLMRLGLGEAICRVGGREDDFNLRTDALPTVDAKQARERREEIRRRSALRWGTPVEDHGKRPADGHATGAPEAAPEVPVPPSTAHTVGDGATAPGGTPEDDRRGPPAPEPKLDKRSLDYLHLVAAEPFLATRERNDQLGLSAWKGDRLKKDLVREGLVREVAVNPGGRGGRFLLLELTTDGRAVLARFGIAPAVGLGRGGVAHQWWVGEIASWLEERGASVSIEDESSGARVDLLVTIGRRQIAVEVEMTDGHAAENIRKDLTAGFETVVSLVDSGTPVERLRQALQQPPSGVRIAVLQDFREALAPLLHRSSASLRPPNQDQEPSGTPERRRRKRPRQSPPAITPGLLGEQGALSTPAAAEYLGLSPATLETMRSRGGGPPFVKLGRRVVYQREDLDAWLDERKRRSTSDPGGAS